MAIEVPPHWTHEETIRHFLREIIENQHLILTNQEKQMAAIDNLNANVAKLQTDVNTFIASQQSGSEAAIQAAADAVAAIDTEVVAATPAPATPAAPSTTTAPTV
jgi:hypothetical protein